MGHSPTRYLVFAACSSWPVLNSRSSHHPFFGTSAFSFTTAPDFTWFLGSRDRLAQWPTLKRKPRLREAKKQRLRKPKLKNQKPRKQRQRSPKRRQRQKNR